MSEEADRLRQQLDDARRELKRKTELVLSSREQATSLRERLLDLRERYKGRGEELKAAREKMRRYRDDVVALRPLLLEGGDLPAPIVRTMREVIGRRWTMINPAALVEMVHVVLELEQRGVEGAFVETGAALGGSAILLAALKDPGRELFVHDVFGLIPPPGDEDDQDVHDRYSVIAAGDARGISGDEYYGYKEDLLETVRDNFARAGYPVEQNSVRLVQGLFQDTVHPSGPIALAHLDGDWYESTKVPLERMLPHIVVGGLIMIDDYESWSGARKAVDEVMAGRDDFERIEGVRLRFARLR